AQMAMQFRGALLRPGDPGYDGARVVYNGMFDRKPGLIIRCSGTADVIDAVNFARQHDLVVAVRGGGHNIAGNAVCDDGLVIDLSQMRGVHVDRDAKTVRVQGGALWGDVDRETQAFGLVAPGGIVSHTGVAGLTLSGGIGWVRDKCGLSCDNLIAAEVVTANGELVEASEKKNKDLLWALRGGGGNFGIVTSFEFKLHPVGPIVAAAFPMYPIEKAPKILRQWRDFLEGKPDEITSAAVMWTMPVAEGLPPGAQGKAVVITGGVYAGDPNEGEKALQPLREFAEPLGEISGQLPYRAVQAAFDPFFPNTGAVHSYWKSVYANELSDELIDILADLGNNRSSSYSLINVPYFGGAVKRVKPTDTAFWTREPSYMLSLDGNWTDPSEREQHVAWVRQAWDRLQPHSTGAVYLNFMGEETQDPDAVVRAAFGDNYARLVELKTKYDPDNLFRMNQNIKPR
ncbi:MAG: FAD-binding oxidoreductase, partial [Dehalococcoidia bacterium]